MRSSILCWLGVLVGIDCAATGSAASSQGFSSASSQSSAGGHARCVSGLVQIPLNSTNLGLNLDEPKNQYNVTELIQELAQTGSTLGVRVAGAPKAVTGNYNLDVSLCFPASKSNNGYNGTLQILNHGVGFDKTYWDIAPGYSYVDYAAQQGYATLAYSLLGVGRSDHPDPLQVVQTFAHVEMLHGLVGLARSGKLGNIKFPHVVGVGHSYGSAVQLGLNAKYPSDFDATVDTGFTSTLQYLAGAILSTNPIIASQDANTRYPNLPNAYLLHHTSISISQAFFRYPAYDPSILDRVVATKSTYSFGMVFTLPALFQPASSYTGPVAIVLGQNDFVFCGGDCSIPSDQGTLTLTSFYPARAAGSKSIVIPGTGHAINAHTTAGQAFQQIVGFIQGNGF